MPVFNAKYLSDEEIWSRIDKIVQERDEVHRLLAKPEVSTDPCRMPELAKKLNDLNPKCLLFHELRSLVKDLRELEEMIGEKEPDEEHELVSLHREYLDLCRDKALQVYQTLMEMGLLPEEVEDETDLAILKFIEYAGPEYAWRLGINIGLDVAESRRRLEALLEKGLLERVPGNMLEGYHRQKDWIKHMNHTYYRITREGRHYLRKLRRGLEDLSEG
ncbi:DUF2250 domain-containing protein [Desulforamulus putei]|uniref:PCRF domain-containing protein n=1 Tax=Desulforamulus putei DSM 12395 TaxID=1121429 RepID=A0A1M5A5P0_9FIRM|nr:DUF2250 domain-containing protein [Desulforamulus putei]SHF25570.1 PCRF domain-containing protein [Desulforamulus putei DSM 12395]